MSYVNKSSNLKAKKFTNDNLVESRNSFTLFTNVNYNFNNIIYLQNNKNIFNQINNKNNRKDYFFLKKEDSKIEININPIENYNQKNFCTVNNYYHNTKNKTLNRKSRNVSNIFNFCPTTVNCKTNCNDNIEKLLMKKINKTLNNNESLNKKIAKIFSLNADENKNSIKDKRNNIKNKIFFSKNEKRKIYKNYFSVDNKETLYKKKKINISYKTLNNESNRIFNESQKTYSLKKQENGAKYERAKRLIIPNEIYLSREIKNYKKRIINLKTSIIINKRKIKIMKEKNKNIEKYLENKKNTINLINNLINENMNYFKRSNHALDDVKTKTVGIKKEYDDKKLINNIINAMKKLYLDYNYSFSSDEAKKIINYNEISFQILYYWIKNVPKLIFYEHIKNDLNKKKDISKKYEIFMKNIFQFFGVNSLEELIYSLNKLIENISKQYLIVN